MTNIFRELLKIISIQHCLFSLNYRQKLQKFLKHGFIAKHHIRLLISDGPFTVLAPIDSAFDIIDVPALLDNPTELNAVLTRHVIGAKVESGDLENGPVPTLGGEIIFVEIEGSTVSFKWWLAELALAPVVLGSIHLLQESQHQTATERLLNLVHW